MNLETNSIGLLKKPSDTTVVVAMSGGVDSSTVAGIMKKEGYNVIGITLKLYDEGKIQKSDGGQLFLANSEAWGNDRLVRKFRGALATMTRNTIINATPADKPTIIDGVVYAKMNPALRASFVFLP